jgi:hypothetical protein
MAKWPIPNGVKAPLPAQGLKACPVAAGKTFPTLLNAITSYSETL